MKQNKQTMKLNEDQLRNIVKDGIKKVLNEGFFQNQVGQAVKKQFGQSMANMYQPQQGQNQGWQRQNNGTRLQGAQQQNQLTPILNPLKNLLSFENNLKQKYQSCADNEIGMYQNILNDIAQIKQYLTSAGLMR